MAEPLAVHFPLVLVEHGEVLLSDAADGDFTAAEEALDEAIDSGRFLSTANSRSHQCDDSGRRQHRNTGHH